MLCRIAWCAIRNAYCSQGPRNSAGTEGGIDPTPHILAFMFQSSREQIMPPYYYSCSTGVTGFLDLPTTLNLCLLLFTEECRIAVMNKEKMSTGLPRRHLNWTLKKNEWHETYSFSTYSVIWIYFLCSTNSCSNFLISL